MSIRQPIESYGESTNWWFITRLADIKKTELDELTGGEFKECIEKLEWAWEELRQAKDALEESQKAHADAEQDSTYYGREVDKLQDEVFKADDRISELESLNEGLNERIDQLLKENADLEFRATDERIKQLQDELDAIKSRIAYQENNS